MRDRARNGAWKTALERLGGALRLDLGGDHRDAVVLAGSGRSGTTWLADMICHSGGYRLIFEPFERRQYLRPGDDREEFLDPAQDILSGKVRSLWSDRFRGGLVFRRRLVKDIRANLMLGWIKAAFPETPVILLLRHPCAVAASRMRLGWRDNLEETMRQKDLVEDFLAPFEAEIRAAKTPFERHVFLWCIDNYVPLMQLAPDDAHLVFYEDLREDPADELRRISAFLARDLDGRALRGLDRPSSLSFDGEVAPPDAWRETLDREQIERATEILALFGLDVIYGESPRPDSEAARALMEHTRAR